MLCNRFRNRFLNVIAVAGIFLWPLASAVAAEGEVYMTIFGAKISWSDKEYVGHSFLCISLHTNIGPKEDCFGFYPRNNTALMFIGTPGATNSEFIKNPRRFSKVETSVEIKVSKKERSDIMTLADSWNKKSYSFIDQNCINFVEAVLRLTTANVPKRVKFKSPGEYVKELARLN